MKKKNCIFCVLFLVSGVVLSAQAEMTLPDVTTVVSGDSLTAGKNAVPDFSDVLPGTPGGKEVLPELPDVTVSGNAGADEAVSKTEPENSVYAEGLAGGGLPGFFTGRFSVYRSAGKDPFRIGFNYESADGYARNAFTDGYYDRTVKISGEKTVTAENAVYTFNGNYESDGDGLQNTCPGFYDVTKQTIGGKADAVWTLPNGFGLKSHLDTDWYNRFAGITGSPSAAGYAEHSSVFSMSPSAQFGWESHGFSSYFDAAWYLQSDTGKALSEGSTNRARFGTGLGWENSFITVFGNAAAVIGTEIGNNDVIVPFTVGIKSSFVTGLSPRKMSITAEGGLSSDQLQYAELEKKYKFSALSFIPGETTDWYGTFTADVPVKDMFSVTTQAEYRSTAFGNGVWEPSYTDSSFEYGQYTYSQTDRSQLYTAAGVSFSSGILTLRGAWKSQWIYVPVLEAPNAVELSVSLQGTDSRWGTDADISFFPDEGEDHVPEINISGYIRLTRAVRLAVTADDVVKLVAGQPRTYAGRYIARSGSAGLLVKFFF
jgi:hypothetical protein